MQQSYIDESPAWEYVEGEVIQKPMGGGKHSTLPKRLVAAIDQASSNYEAFPELRCTLENRSVVPDIAVVARDRIPLCAGILSRSPAGVVYYKRSPSP
jgi:Uma2 family endonuclease